MKKLSLLYICQPGSLHNQKWIDHFAKIHSVGIVCYQSDDIPERYVDFTYPILPDTFPLKRMDILISTVGKFKQIIKKRNVQLIHSMYFWHYGFWPYFAKQIPHVLTTYGTDVLSSLRSIDEKHGFLAARWVKHVAFKSLQQASVITSTSHNQMEAVASVVHHPKPIEWIPTGIDTDFFVSMYPQSPEVSVVFSSRSMTPIYRIEWIVKAFAEVIKTHPTARLVLTDDHPQSEYASTIYALIESLSLKEKVSLVKLGDQATLKSRYENAGLVVMWPKSDGLPNTGLEALAMKRPLILPPLSYDHEVFNDSTTWMGQDESVESLAGLMLKVIAKADLGELEKKATAGRSAVVEYASIQQSLKKLSEIYQRNAIS